MRIASIDSSDLPRLHSLTICGSSAHGVFPPSPGLVPPNSVGLWAKSGVVCTPSLRSISYNNITEDFTQFPLQWSQLTSISLQGIAWPAAEAMSVARLAHVLARCHCLRHCRLEVASLRHSPGVSPDVAEEPLPTLIALPHLTSLIISAGRIDLSALLEALEVHAHAPRGARNNAVSARTPCAPPAHRAHASRALARPAGIHPHRIFHVSRDLRGPHQALAAPELLPREPGVDAAPAAPKLARERRERCAGLLRKWQRDL